MHTQFILLPCLGSARPMSVLAEKLWNLQTAAMGAVVSEPAWNVKSGLPGRKVELSTWKQCDPVTS